MRAGFMLRWSMILILSVSISAKVVSGDSHRFVLGAAWYYAIVGYECVCVGALASRRGRSLGYLLTTLMGVLGMATGLANRTRACGCLGLWWEMSPRMLIMFAGTVAIMAIAAWAMESAACRTKTLAES